MRPGRFPSGAAGGHSGGQSGGQEPERRIRANVFLRRLTVADGEWLAQTLPTLQRRARPALDAVRLENVALRYRSGRLGIADALDATEALLQPFAVAGAQVERRHEWYISDDDDDDDDDDDVSTGPHPTSSASSWWATQFASSQPDEPPTIEEHDLLVSVRVRIDASAEDAGAAALYWATLGLLH
ncbi:MAG: hypothetical protein ABI068_13105 [Ktedonobacterales bacterium]